MASYARLGVCAVAESSADNQILLKDDRKKLFQLVMLIRAERSVAQSEEIEAVLQVRQSRKAMSSF
jgi:hypothetical protein